MLAVHSIGPGGRVRCDATNARQATTEAKNVTCLACLRMIEKAKRAAEMLRFPPERWP